MDGSDNLTKEVYLKEQHEWYELVPAIFEIVKELKGHTMDILSSKLEPEHFGVRYFYAGSDKFFKQHLKALGVLTGKKLINIYRSTAHLKPNSIPIFTYNLSERRKDEKYIEFDKNFVEFIDGFDLVVDIDSPKKDVLDAWKVTKEIKKLFDDAKLPYYLKSSGTRGFHLIIEAKYQPSNIKPLDLQMLHQRVLYNLAGIYDWKDYIDLSVASHPKTLIKCAYSFDSSNISLPLNDFEFDNFNPEKIKMKYVLKNIYVKDRGLFVRKHQLSEDELKENMIKFLKDYQ